MAAEFRQTAEHEMEAIRKLMQNSFHVQPDAPSMNPELLRWKYYQQGPAWAGSRSYVLSGSDAFLAHAAIWPLQLRLESGIRSGIGFGDWVAREEHRGAGLILLKKLLGLTSFVLAIGGADITRQILPRVGFKHWADLPVYARVLRPLKQVLSRPSHDWKEPLRLARNTGWSLAPLPSIARWTAESSIPGEELLALVHGKTGLVHDSAFFRFVLSCPGVQFRSLVLRKASLPLGYAVLSIVGGQARIAEFRIASEDQADWNAAVSSVTKELLKEKLACEVIALASFPLLEKALQTNGFRVRDRRPLVVFDLEGDMTTEPVPPLSLLVDDASFNYFPDAPYMT